jgi:hypothetical protein
VRLFWRADRHFNTAALGFQSGIKLGRDDGAFFYRAPDAAQHGSASRGPLYFVWGCFRDFLSRPCRPLKGRYAGSGTRHRWRLAFTERIDPTPTSCFKPEFNGIGGLRTYTPTRAGRYAALLPVNFGPRSPLRWGRFFDGAIPSVAVNFLGRSGASPLLVRMHPIVRRDLLRRCQLDHVHGRRAPTSGRVGSHLQPAPTADGSVFWPSGVINPVLGLFVGPTGNSVILAGSARCGRTVWIAVVRMQMDLADSQQLKADIQPYQKLLGLGLDPLTIAIQRSRKLLALGLDPLTIGRIDRVIQELVQHKPANALTANRLGTSTGFSPRRGRKAAGILARVTH